MASTSRPPSAFLPSSAGPIQSSLSADHLTPLRRQSVSPPGSGHYTLRRVSYIAELPPQAPFVTPPRPRSVFRSASFSNMTFGFNIKDKGKEKDKDKETSKPATPTTPSSPASPTPPPTIKARDRPSTSSGFFSSMQRAKSLKKKRSLASLLETAASEAAAPSASAPPASRARSSDAASTLTAIPFVSKEKTTEDILVEQRMKEYKRLSRSEPYTRWTVRHKMKVHSDYRAPYMQAYDPIMLENDRQSNLLLRRLNPLDSPTFHNFGNKELIRILDLGCGAGHWLFEASRRWKYATLTGIDLINILIPEVRDCSRVDLVQGNFLSFPWPVESRAFDLVRMANLSLCIPYDKWELVLGEAHRVLRVNGRLELIDDEIIFPYSPEPTSRPTSLSAPIRKLVPVRRLSKGGTLFDIDKITQAAQHYDDEEGGDGDGDGDSVTTDSTLVSDVDASLRSRRQSSTSTAPSDTLSSAAQLDAPTSPADIPTTPTSVATIKPPESLSLPPPSNWSLDAKACKDIETVYVSMLQKKFGIHTKTSKFVADVMQHVFGNAEKVKSYHVKLAPKDAQKEFGYRSENELVSSGALVEKEKEKEKVMGDSKKESQWRPWFGGDSEKEEKKRLKKSSKSSSPGDFDNMTASDVLDIRLPESLSTKAADRLGITGDIPMSVSRVPENVSAKAAHRLGIPMSSDRAFEAPTRSSASPPDLLEDSEDDDVDNASETPSTSSVPAPSTSISTSKDTTEPVEQESSTTQDDKRLSTISMSSSSGDSKLSAKAAHRLGISYSALSEATASAKASTRRPLSSSSTLVSSHTTPAQSPGLIVSNRFIPMSPSELEMHALKTVHMLIGCKPALAAYVACFVDKDGKKIESDENFDGALWEYECFRRRRFNWPDLPPGSWDDTDIDATDSVVTPTSDAPVRSATLRNSLVFDTSLPPPPLDSKTKTRSPYKSNKLTHVRSIRVYESVKTSEYTLSTMKNPRSPAPSPPH